MRKVKILNNYYTDDLEKRVNSFLKELESTRIENGTTLIDIKFQQNEKEVIGPYGPEKRNIYTALLLYSSKN